MKHHPYSSRPGRMRGFCLLAVAKLNNANDCYAASSYASQGFGYSNDTLYVPLTYKNVSVVLVYRHPSTASGTLKSDADLSFRITSAAYADLFEIEGVGIGSGGKLWFSTNRRTKAGDTAHDGVHYFNGFKAA